MVDNYWLLLSDRNWTLSVDCGGYAKTDSPNITAIQITVPVYILHLSPECKATSRYFIVAAQLASVLNHGISLPDRLSMQKFPSLNLSALRIRAESYQLPRSIVIDQLTLDESDDLDGMIYDVTDDLADNTAWINKDFASRPAKTKWYIHALLGLVILVILGVTGLVVLAGIWYCYRGKAIIQFHAPSHTGNQLALSPAGCRYGAVPSAPTMVANMDGDNDDLSDNESVVHYANVTRAPPSGRATLREV